MLTALFQDEKFRPTSVRLAEAAIYKQVFDAINDQTLVLVTHRLGAIKYVDRIIVMEQGRIVEDGSHDDLMQQHGKYYEMYTVQAKWYEE